MGRAQAKRKALYFVLLMGVVSLFADMAYEGSRSVIGQYMAVLGASAAVIGLVAGLGELIGYSLRLAAGYLSDKTGRYWPIAITGYALNLLAVPMVALADSWTAVAALIWLERFGKALRSPAKDALLSYACKETGRGWGFGVHEALDQIGAVAGPLLMSGVLLYQSSYKLAFATLGVPALAALAALAAARLLFPKPQEMENERAATAPAGRAFSPSYRLYVAATCCVAAGFVDFPLLAYHFKHTETVSEAVIPLLFAVAMAADGAAALLLGRLYDVHGVVVLVYVTALGAAALPLFFYGGLAGALVAVVLWGIGLGAQESVMRAVVADLVPKDRRATAYGLFNIWFGLFWFIGSVAMGRLYEIEPHYLLYFALLAQLAALPLFIRFVRKAPHR